MKKKKFFYVKIKLTSNIRMQNFLAMTSFVYFFNLEVKFRVKLPFIRPELRISFRLEESSSPVVQ